MNDVIGRIAELEWANYAATYTTAQVTPGLDIILRDDVIITSSEVLPFPDANHACLLRATPRAVEGLVDKVEEHFAARGLPATIFISPACTPPDLTEHLSRRGFVKQEEEEAWMVLERLADYELPSPSPKVTVRRIAKDETMTVAEIFMAAFGMPVDFAPYMAQLLEPSVDVPGVYHYVALVDEQPVGTCSLLCYEAFGILGSAGVLPTRRGKGAATSLAIEAATEARRQGVDTLILQTTAGTRLERLLRISGFKRAFTRTCFTLP